MGINWKIRIKNPSFWVGIAIAVFAPIAAYMGITAADITTWDALWNMIVQAVSSPYILMIVGASVYNAIVDPTTTGITDSANALSYDAPNGEKG